MFGIFRAENKHEARFAHLERHVAQLHGTLEALAKRLDGTTSAVLRADLDDLRAAVEVDRLALRKQLGKIWGKIGREPSNGSPLASGNDELDAWLKLQEGA